MKSKEFNRLLVELDGCNRHQLKRIINESLKLIIEMLPNKEKGGF